MSKVPPVSCFINIKLGIDIFNNWLIIYLSVTHFGRFRKDGRRWKF